MKSFPLLSIIIPVYNEKENIKKTLQEIKKKVKLSYEIIIIYDSETDNSIPVIKLLQKNHPEICLVKNSIAKGPSGAIRTGFSFAKGQHILVMMADLCDDISQINEMITIANSHTMIICPSRYMKGGRQELNAFGKVIIPKIAGLLLHILSGISTHDPTNSFKLYPKKIIEKLHLKSTISFSVTLEIIVKAHCLGYKIIEIPTVWKDRQYGKTNFKLLQSIGGYFPWFCFALLSNRLFKIPKKIIKKFI